MFLVFRKQKPEDSPPPNQVGRWKIAEPGQGELEIRIVEPGHPGASTCGIGLPGRLDAEVTSEAEQLLGLRLKIANEPNLACMVSSDSATLPGGVRRVSVCAARFAAGWTTSLSVVDIEPALPNRTTSP